VDTAALIDAIYEASCAPERWPRVLDGIAELCDGEGTLLVVATREDLRWTSSPAIEKAMAAWLGLGELGKNARSARLIGKREARFHTDLDAFTPAELERERARHRSPMVMRCVEDFMRGQRNPVEFVAHLTKGLVASG